MGPLLRDVNASKAPQPSDLRREMLARNLRSEMSARVLRCRPLVRCLDILAERSCPREFGPEIQAERSRPGDLSSRPQERDPRGRPQLGAAAAAGFSILPMMHFSMSATALTQE